MRRLQRQALSETVTGVIDLTLEEEKDLAQQILNLLAGQSYFRAYRILHGALNLLDYQAKIPKAQSTSPDKKQALRRIYKVTYYDSENNLKG